MSLRSQSARLAAQGACFRRETSGRGDVVWQGKTYDVAHTGVNQGRDLEGGGFEFQPDCILRIPTGIYPLFTPALGDTITVDGVALMVRELLPLDNACEIKVTLAKP